MMNRIGTICLLALGLAACDANALEAKQSSYDLIAKRNLFRLRDVAATKQTFPPVLKQLRKVTLTGITTILGKRMAFITIAGTKSLPRESVVIAEGEAVNGIEVKGVDEKAVIVRILNDGELQILHFEPVQSSGMQPNPGPRFSPPSATPAQVEVEAVMTPEEQVALIELQRIKFQQEGNPIHTLLPLAEMTSNDEDYGTP